MRSHTTTTSRRQPASNETAAQPAPALSDVQRWALTLAERQGWGVEVQARDGSRLQLRRGYPGRALVLFLSSAAAERS